MALKGFISIAEFDILELIGGGAYGRVFKAKRKNEKETFAIKCIKLSNDDDVELVYSSMRELTEMRRLHHPNIVQYYCGWWETLPPSWRRNSKQDQVDVSWSSQSDDFSSEAEISIDYEKRMKMEDERWGNVSDSSLSYQLALSAKSDGSATRRDDEVQREWLQHKRLTSQETSELKCRSNKTYLYLYIKMELCRKENLADWLKTPISQRVQLDVNNMFQSILQAVHYLHNQNIIHRDLKPSNIFFNSEWSIKIGDFGLSKGMTMEQALLTSDVNYGQTRSGTGTSRMNHTVYVGTKPYMAPEQEKCQTYNHKVDVYALAIILFELLIPFGSASERLIAISNLKVYQLPPKFEEIYGTKFKRLLIKMVSENPDIRPEIKNILSEYNIIALDLNISEQIDHYFSLIPRRLQREDIDLHPPQIRRMQYSDSKKRIVSTVIHYSEPEDSRELVRVMKQYLQYLQYLQSLEANDLWEQFRSNFLQDPPKTRRCRHTIRGQVHIDLLTISLAKIRKQLREEAKFTNPDKGPGIQDIFPEHAAKKTKSFRYSN